jgi:hypothetical protein
MEASFVETEQERCCNDRILVPVPTTILVQAEQQQQQPRLVRCIRPINIREAEVVMMFDFLRFITILGGVKDDVVLVVNKVLVGKHTSLSTGRKSSSCRHHHGVPVGQYDSAYR